MRETEEKYIKHLQNEVFNRLFKEAAIAKFSKNELREYENSLKAYRDIKNCVDTAKQEEYAKWYAEGYAEGYAKGVAEARVEIAQKLLSMELSIEDIAKATSLFIDEVKDLSKIIRGNN